ncbi:hypothetical protein H0A36_28420 [Endozoicomonas sp. SM1973]|uniref:Uncharacterized protein n=1 Tax=Spartinivicinus marinus TaxID=2994442 RepID=A0A853IIT4_9GAMM|nr:hypothetical protein [Spartinivicinus marinus]NYZ69944.1 hypothetical protein [Spartinivicinus marinus]
MKPMATRLPERELKANQALRRRKTEAEIMWEKISREYHELLKINNSLRIRLRYQLDKTKHRLLREPAGF